MPLQGKSRTMADGEQVTVREVAGIGHDHPPLVLAQFDEVWEAAAPEEGLYLRSNIQHGTRGGIVFVPDPAAGAIRDALATPPGPAKTEALP